MKINLEPLTADRCEVCGLQLYPSERVEVTSAERPGMTEAGYGGGGITAVYCEEHAP